MIGRYGASERGVTSILIGETVPRFAVRTLVELLVGCIGLCEIHVDPVRPVQISCAEIRSSEVRPPAWLCRASLRWGIRSLVSFL
jgi:hypothetical protein